MHVTAWPITFSPKPEIKNLDPERFQKVNFTSLHLSVTSQNTILQVRLFNARVCPEVEAPG